MDQYIAWLKERVEQMHRILRPTGSIFLHCDWHADAYIRVQILDKIFGDKNFRNHVIWKRSFTKKGSQFKMTKFAANSDSIFVYSKSDKYTFHAQKTKNLTDTELFKLYDKVDENGRRYKSEPIELPKMMARKKLVFEYKGYTPKFGWMMNLEKLEELDRLNKIYFSKNGKPRRKNFLDDYAGAEVDNIWTDIQPIGQVQSETIGYPTQKPEALLERIIKCASNESSTVLDPFMGGGTTIAVADRLNRKWIGIDQSVRAVKVTELRLSRRRELLSAPFTVQLHKYDYDTLRHGNAFEFEIWIVQQFGGLANTKQRSDFGFDGKMPDNAPIQAIRSDNVGRNVIDGFLSAVKRADKKLYDNNIEDKKPIGHIIAFSFNKGAIQEVARLKNHESIIINLVRVEDIVPISKKPTTKIEIKELMRDSKGVCEIEFTASGQSSAGIEFYSWDFGYNPDIGFKADVIIDKPGKQNAKFKAGLHSIAVKAVDNDGLESIEVIKLKVNGTVDKA